MLLPLLASFALTPPPRSPLTSRRAVIAALPFVLTRGRPAASAGSALYMSAAGADIPSAIVSAWDKGDPATDLRSLVETASTSPTMRTRAAAISGSTTGWKGLWVARIEHFEKVKFTGLRVRPHYSLDDDGTIVSHVHIVAGPISLWASAAGFMQPSADGSAEVRLTFNDFWISGDAPRPRDAPSEFEASTFDTLTRALGRSMFFEGLAAFPVDYADLDTGIVSFRFTAFNSCIVARRTPEGEAPQRCPSS